MRYAIPIGVFVLLIAVLAVGLRLDPRYVPSPLIDKSIPEFSLPALRNGETNVSSSHLRDRPRLLNVWASWCAACRVEHPLLLSLAKTGQVDIVGLNYKDERTDALAWLARHGDPYAQIIYDVEGRLGLDLGVYGVPETFIIDKNGIIRHKQVGPLNDDTWNQVILPMLSELASEP